ncbi:hypothetical protein AAHA92_11003 [Salvia divinorum]|uniref:Uncharacterized protein n=1 Tax=Salvia divinorum TaxID=28513 RepID=A0ABD1HWK7_SALDI
MAVEDFRALSLVMERVRSCGNSPLRLEFLAYWSMVSVISGVEFELVTIVSRGKATVEEEAGDGRHSGGKEEEEGGGEDEDKVEEN